MQLLITLSASETKECRERAINVSDSTRKDEFDSSKTSTEIFVQEKIIHSKVEFVTLYFCAPIHVTQIYPFVLSDSYIQNEDSKF